MAAYSDPALRRCWTGLCKEEEISRIHSPIIRRSSCTVVKGDFRGGEYIVQYMLPMAVPVIPREGTPGQ